MKARTSIPKLSKRESHVLYEGAANDAARSIIGAVLYVMHLRKWHKDKIQKLYDDILSVLDMPPVFGEAIRDYQIRDFLRERYDIDFSRIKLQCELVSEEQSKKNALIRKEENKRTGT